MKNGKLKVAIIGFGGMGHFHAASYANQKYAELAAVCDTDESKFRQAKEAINVGSSGAVALDQVKCCTSYEELVRSVRFDVLDICLPCHLHAEYAVRAMREGFDVLCEKPMARTLAQADRMLRTAEETGRHLMIAQCLRFSPRFIFLKEAVQGGKYGKLLRLDMRRNSALPPNAWYHDHRKSGGALLDLHLHDTDLVNWIFGTPDAVQTFGVSRESGGIDDLLSCYIFEGGPIVNAEASWCRGGWSFGIIAVCEKATLAIGQSSITVYRRDKPAEEVSYDKTSHYALEIASFTECVARNRPFDICPAASARESIRIALAEERSARNNGRKIRLK